MNSYHILIFVIGYLFSSCQLHYDTLEQDFSNPPDSIKLWCYYYWINDDISKEGITRDLQSMKKVGIGTALIGNINPAGKDGHVPLFSEAWWDAMVHTVNEGKRIGIDVGIFNCPGWSQSGGPWVSADHSMRYLTYSESKVLGPGKVKINLPKPDSLFKDICVLAFPTSKSEVKSCASSAISIRTFPPVNSAEKMIDGDISTGAEIEKELKEFRINISFKDKKTANSLLLYPSKPFMADCQLFAKINGENILIREFHFDRSNFSNKVGPVIAGPLALALKVEEASEFSLILKNIKGPEPKAGISEVVITENAILEKYIEKQLGKMHPNTLPQWDTYYWEEQQSLVAREMMVQKDRIVYLSENLTQDGSFDWNVPEGNWTLVRFGMSPTGVKNHPAAPQGVGFEVDKLNSENVRLHFKNFVGELLKRVPDTSKSALKYVVIDSYEVGSQNWTDDYSKKFKEKYSYDPIPYLPVLTGRIVGSVTESERFLWDLRRAVADDIAYEYVGGLKKISNENNLKLWLENYGHWGFPSEFLIYGGQTDMVGGEFWNEGNLGNIECKAASSSAHIYGKPTVFCEAFTSAQNTFLRHPARLKSRGDWSFTEGINQFVLHLYIHQPDEKRIPGVNAWFGTEFNRHNTWFNHMEGWTEYLRRCQLLLQQGKYVADVCYFIGEDAPVMTGGRNPELPSGYSYDYINSDVILNRLSVKDGQFVLPDGMSYKLMVLPDRKTMRPEVLSKLKMLVRQGGKILGPAPIQSPSLQNYPACDRQVQNIAAEMWPEKEEKGIFNYGKGMVIHGVKLQKALDTIHVQKDVKIENQIPVLWTHRHTNEREIYFLTNQSQQKRVFEPAFRVTGLKPQFWDPISGEIRTLKEYTETKNYITVPLELAPLQSCFIVFSNHKISQTDESNKVNFPTKELLKSITGNWQVEFLNKKIGPTEPLVIDSLKDWSLFENPLIKYYSGTAVYRTTFHLEHLPLDEKVFLNLGNVQVMANVNLNEHNLATLWIAPYLTDTKGYLKKGDNVLEIELVNLWRNRLILDKSLPKENQYTWTVTNDVRSDEPLQSSGLIGPVTLEISH